MFQSDSKHESFGKCKKSSQKQEGGRDASLLSSCQRNVSDIHATNTFLLCSVVRTKFLKIENLLINEVGI